MPPTDPEGDDDGSARAAPARCPAKPGYGRERLPHVARPVDHGERVPRVAAAGVAVREGDEAVASLARRLGNRPAGEDTGAELTHALGYLAARYPELVAEALAAVARARETDGSVPLSPVRSPARAHARGPGGDREAARRTRTAGHDRDPGPPGPCADAECESRDVTDDERASDTGTGPRDESGDTGPDPETVSRWAAELSSVAVHSRSGLRVAGARPRGRHADPYRAPLEQGDAERAVAVGLSGRPERVGGRSAFGRGVEDRLAGWAGVRGHDHVASVLDWNVEPRPWPATAFADETPADRAMADARTPAEVVAHLHRQGVVHGGSVGYTGGRMDDGTGRVPLDGVGLMHAVRYYLDPAPCLGPGYAAPECLGDRFGRVDHGTDSYRFGAVLYGLLAGQPPYTGTVASIAEAVTGGGPPRPSAVADVPPVVDTVVKPTTTRRRARDRTIERMQAEPAGLTDG